MPVSYTHLDVYKRQALLFYDSWAKIRKISESSKRKTKIFHSEMCIRDRFTCRTEDDSLCLLAAGISLLDNRNTVRCSLTRTGLRQRNHVVLTVSYTHLISLLRWAASTIASPSRRSISALPSSVWRRTCLTTATPTSPCD